MTSTDLVKDAGAELCDREVAVRDAREATGMDVQLESHSPDGQWTHYDLTIYSPNPGEALSMPTVQRDGLSHQEVLAYLSGLEAGARIQRERHVALVEAGALALETLNSLTSDQFQRGADKPARTALTAALADLEN